MRSRFRSLPVQSFWQHLVRLTTSRVWKHFPWVLLSQTSSSGIVRLKHEEQHISLRPKHTYLVNSPSLLQKMVSSGVGLGVLLPGTVKSEIETGQLIRLMPQMHSETLLFSLVYPSRKQLRFRTRTVIAFLPESKLFK